MAKAKRRHSKNTVKRSRILENAVDALHIVGFEIFDGVEAFRRATIPRKPRKGAPLLPPLPPLPPRYIYRSYPHVSLYGTRGKKEALIHDNGKEYILEAKLQDGSGSVDEKLPYIFECFLVSPVLHWIVIFDGHFWTKHERGLKALEWFRQQLKYVPDDRSLHICGNAQEWRDTAKRLFNTNEGKP